jgi:hypothetical protein
MNKIKNTIRIITAVSLGLYISYCILYFFTNEIHPKYKDCGIIESKSTDEVAIKHGTRTDLYLNIQFEKSGFKSISVDPTTYFKSKKGEYVCFNLKQDMTFSHHLKMMVALLTLVILVMVLIIGFIYYLFN